MSAKILWIDAFAAIAVGVVTLLLIEPLAHWYRLPQDLLSFIAIINLVYGTYSLGLAYFSKRPLALLVILIVANFVWSLNCLRMIVTHFDQATILGLAYLFAEAVVVLIFSINEWRFRNCLVS